MSFVRSNSDDPYIFFSLAPYDVEAEKAGKEIQTWLYSQAANRASSQLLPEAAFSLAHNLCKLAKKKFLELESARCQGGVEEDTMTIRAGYFNSYEMLWQIQDILEQKIESPLFLKGIALEDADKASTSQAVDIRETNTKEPKLSLILKMLKMCEKITFNKKK